MPRMIVLQQVEPSTWKNVGGVEVEVDDVVTVEVAQQIAVEEKAQELGAGGAFIAVPFEWWNVFEAVAQITVSPVRKGRVNDDEPVRDDDEIGGEEPLDPDLAGLSRPGDMRG